MNFSWPRMLRETDGPVAMETRGLCVLGGWDWVGAKSGPGDLLLQ